MYICLIFIGLGYVSEETTGRGHTCQSQKCTLLVLTVCFVRALFAGGNKLKIKSAICFIISLLELMKKPIAL